MIVVTRRLRSQWERRLPEIASPWTHWRLFGDEELLADVAGADVLAALAVIEAGVATHRRIYATFCKYGHRGFLAADKTQFEIHDSRTFRRGYSH